MNVKANGICNECDEPARVIVFSGGADEYSHGVCEDCLALAAKRLDNGMNCGEVKSAAPPSDDGVTVEYRCPKCGDVDQHDWGSCKRYFAPSTGESYPPIESAAPAGTARRCAIYDAACLTPMACGETGACLAGAPAGTAPTEPPGELREAIKRVRDIQRASALDRFDREAIDVVLDHVAAAPAQEVAPPAGRRPTHG